MRGISRPAATAGLMLTGMLAGLLTVGPAAGAPVPDAVPDAVIDAMVAEARADGMVTPDERRMVLSILGGRSAEEIAAVAARLDAPTAPARPAAADGRAKWGPHIDLEGKWGTDRSLGEADLLAPLWQDSESLLFASIRARLDDGSSSEGNFGLGYRRMLANGWNLGGYGYLDVRRSPNDNIFYQTTLGLEALSHDWDLRTNLYLPLGDSTKALDPIGGTPYAELSGGTIEVVTPGSLLREEKALTGVDAEVGWRFPLFAAASPTQLRGYVGGYHFTADGVEDVTGPRARLELTIGTVPGLWRGARLSLGAELQRDDVRDTQGFLLARLRIPLQSEAGLSRPLTAQERRMTAPVVRDVDIVTQTRVVGRRAAQREAAVNPLTGAAINAVEAIDAATTGEAAMRAAVTAAGANSVVVLNGAFAVTDTTTLSTGQTIMGGGTSLQVRGATSGTAATFTAPGAAGGLTGAVAGDAVVTLAPDSTVAGLTIANTSTANGSLGIFGSGADGATVTGTAISTAGGNSDGIHLQDSDNGTVSGNRIETVGTNSHGLVVFGGASTVVSDNVFGPIGGSVLFAGGNPSQTIPTSFKGDSTGNSVTGPVGVIRCFNTGGPVSGTVAFTDGQDCTYP